LAIGDPRFWLAHRNRDIGVCELASKKVRERIAMTAAQIAFANAQAVSLVTLLTLTLVLLWLPARVLHKAGYSRWWSLLVLVPLVNLIMLWVFALADWPVLRKN
jgi:uncharacterized membrane protein YhaH (DUF805 family)